MSALEIERIPPALLKKVKSLSKEERAKLIRLARPRVVEPYFKHIPHPVQQVFLNLSVEEALYGGAAGGGKSDALLMAAMQYVDVPGYSALILRRTWPDLNAPGAILDRANDWLSDTPAQKTDGGRIWKFPSGARIQFGYLQYDKDKYKFQSAEYQFIGFDELTHFEQTTYEYMFSRIRRPALNCLNCNTALRVYRNNNGSQYYKHVNKAGKEKCREVFPDPKVLAQYPQTKDGMSIFDVPLRMRSATNPGGIGHLWVKSHFIDPKTRKKGSVFVPARLIDNPSLDQESYEKNLMHLSPIDRERLLNGDWDVEDEGAMFLRHWINVLDEAPATRKETVRYWDLAATVNDDSDYTVGAKVSRDQEGRIIIEDIVRLQGRPSQVERQIMQTAMLDGIGIPIRMEQEPGSAGVNNISNYRRNILQGFNFDGVRSTGSKEHRAAALSSQAEAGNVYIVKGQWNIDFLDELALFPNGAHDDQVDAVTGAYNEIAFGKRSRLIV